MATAEAIDTARGFERFTIGQHITKVVNIGKPSSYEYFGEGVKLAVYRKPRVKIKVGDIAFKNVTMYFGRTRELQMFRLSYSAQEDHEKAQKSSKAVETTSVVADHRAKCESALEKFNDLYGPGYPRGPSTFVWVGHDIQAKWELARVRGYPTCFIEVRATQMQ